MFHGARRGTKAVLVGIGAGVPVKEASVVVRIGADVCVGACAAVAAG